MPHHKPPIPTIFPIANWRCPLCLCGIYHRVVVSRPNGDQYQTEFYQCMRCTNMFIDPDSYTRLGIPVQRGCGDVGPKTLGEAHYYWRDALERKD